MTAALDLPESSSTDFHPGDPANWTPAQRTRNERMSLFLRELQKEGSLSRAYESSGVPEPTVHRWRGEYPPFGEAVTKFVTRTRMQKLEESMYRIALSEDPKMANAAVRAGEFLMKAWDRPQYGDHQRIEQTQTVNHIVQVVHTVRDDIRAKQQEALRRIRTIDAPANEKGHI